MSALRPGTSSGIHDPVPSAASQSQLRLAHIRMRDKLHIYHLAAVGDRRGRQAESEGMAIHV